MDTTHGWPIPNTLPTGSSGRLAKCGGEGVCTTCSAEMGLVRIGMKAFERGETHTEATLFTVFTSLQKVFPDNPVLITDAINQMHNDGILFRERVK